MLVNRDLKFAFIHAAKTAGISLSHWLVDHYGFEYYGDPDAKIAGSEIVERHRFVMPPDCRGFQVFTVIREPFARWESFFLYCRLVMGSDLDWETFTRTRLDWITCQDEYAVRADYILRLDQLAQEVRRLPFVVDPVPPLPRLNVSRDQAAYEATRAEIVWTEELRERVLDRFGGDWIMWNQSQGSV